MKKKLLKFGRCLVVALGSALLLAGTAIFVLTKYMDQVYDLDFGAFLYTLLSTMEGTGGNVVAKGLESCLPPVLTVAAICAILAFFLCQSRVSVRISSRGGAGIDLLRWSRWLLLLAGIVLAASACWFCGETLGAREWLQKQVKWTTIYEDRCVEPQDVSIQAPEKPKNLIYIYLESMETTYASRDVGGEQEVNYIPNLTSLALSKENVSFSNGEGLGGFSTTRGTTWTVGALFATTTGLPYAFPIGANEMEDKEVFASGVTTLGDLLEREGYAQEFLCGSDSAFAGRRTYYQQHGNYEIFDYNTAVERGYIEPDHYVWWGFEDYILYEIAKDEALRLAASGQPFNLTVLTVDQHFEGGYICPKCGDEYETPLANVLACGDARIQEFIDWCKQQDFYEDTVIVITGDHPRMDKILTGGKDTSERQVYNCFLNAAKAPAQSTKNRTFTTMDIFPTVLSAMGYELEGDRLGLGTDMFSARPTLAEEMGLKALRSELNKSSLYYIRNFS